MLKGHLIYNKICSHPAPFRRRSSRPRNRPLVLSRRLDPTPKNFAKAFRQMGCPPKYHWDGLFFSVSDDSDSPSEETSSSRLNAWMLHSSESCCGFCRDQKMAHTCSRSLAETTFQHLRAKEINMLIWIISQAWLEKTKMCFFNSGTLLFAHTSGFLPVLQDFFDSTFTWSISSILAFPLSLIRWRLHCSQMLQIQPDSCWPDWWKLWTLAFKGKQGETWACFFLWKTI
jgi:hypothetical protein